MLVTKVFQIVASVQSTSDIFHFMSDIATARYNSLVWFHVAGRSFKWT